MFHERSFNFLTIVNRQASLNWEEVNILIFKALFNPFLNTRTFRHVLTLNIDDESIVRMQVMLSVNVIMPWYVLNFELRFADSADETDSLDF